MEVVGVANVKGGGELAFFGFFCCPVGVRVGGEREAYGGDDGEVYRRGAGVDGEWE